MRLLRPLAYYAAHAALSVAVLAALPPLRATPLAVPITYERDGLFLTILTKAVQEDGFRHANGIGAPFGTDLVDWPLGMWLPFVQLAGLARLLGEAGSALNVHWMSTIVLAGACAAYAFRRLRVAPGLAFVLGTLYAFQPYAFYRNVEHVNLAFPFVPLLALLCLRVAGARPQDEGRAERTLTLLACLAQGFSYVYYSVFACALLAAAAPVGWLQRRSPRLVLRAALAIVLLGSASLATVAPSLGYWRAHGYNPDLDYKPPGETDTYGLKLRHLLVPIAEHPLPPWRALAERVEAVDFPGDNENALSKLGTVGSVGLLALLGLLLVRSVAASRAGAAATATAAPSAATASAPPAADAADPRDEALATAAVLTLVTLLLANVGGLASFFSVFVTPDVRAWGRIVVLLCFFCLLAVGAGLPRAARGFASWSARAPLPPRLRRRLDAPWARRLGAGAGLGLLLVGGLLDQVPLVRLATLREGTAAAFAEERALVREIEARVPRRAMVFQTPHMTVPVDRVTYPPMLYYDPGRMYVHSRHLRWSWGAMIGRNRDWGRAVDALPVAEKARVLALSGFSGIWIDRWGYTGDPRPPYAAVEAGLSEFLRQPLLVSGRGRYSFVSLEPYRRMLESTLGPDRAAHERRRLLADMPIGPWVSGCEEERAEADGWWRSCGGEATLRLHNWRPGAIRVTLDARLRGAVPGTLVVDGPGFEDRVAFGAGPHPYRRVFEIDGTDTQVPRLKSPRPASLTLRVDDAAACAGRTSCFAIGDLGIETRRLIGGQPVNADGGVAVRTKY